MGNKIGDTRMNSPPLYRVVMWVDYASLLACIIFLHNYRFAIPYVSLLESFGGIISLVGIILIILAHNELPKEHGEPKKITKLATKGIYSKIRHPVYSGFILINFGLSLIFTNYVMFALSILLTPLWYIVSKYEEKFLMKKFGKQYMNYVKRVKWRFFPKVF